MLHEVLAYYGLNAQEASVYLQCLSLGEAPASTVARCIHRNRVTTYSILQNLVKKGAIESYTKKNSTFYSCVDPMILQEHMKQRYEQFSDAMTLFQTVTKRGQHKVKTTVYQGFEGLKTMYQDMIDTGKPIKAFLGVQSVDEDFGKRLNTYFAGQRVKKKIHASVIVPVNAATLAYAKLDKKFSRETRTIDNKIFHLQNEINIYGDNKICIAMFSSEEMSGIRIESDDLHASLSNIFDLLRNTTCSPQKKAR